ncbi:hypothetical protein Q8F55_004756 [Vanrija albida]|uniref:Clathrin/coatomer adaptor adaptin-like N-terminal domain-containing protein n=1 Tax=Vanrija albida TaxID=181172 RepID=A0ABR3PZQ2_9TREE
MPLPPYLSSSASSRAHHALLVKLDKAASPQAEDAAVTEEVARCRALLASGPRQSRVADTLIILLHCATVTHTALDLDFALVHALHLAEGGNSMRERRLGYLFLTECLPPGHELHLLLVNTIRKDLASDNVSHVLAALHAIAHLPGPDLAPAVVPLLTSKRLLEHEVPSVRQRTLQALSAVVHDGPWPLSLRDLARRTRHEDDAPVLATALKTFAQALNAGSREEDPARRRKQFDSVFSAAARHLNASEPVSIILAITKVLTAIVHTLPRRDVTDLEGKSPDGLVVHVLEQVEALLSEITDRITAKPSGAKAYLYDTAILAVATYEVEGIISGPVDQLLEYLRSLLVPPVDKGKGKESSRSHSSSHSRSHSRSLSRTSSQQSVPTRLADSPNDRIVALRCFGVLPPAVWQSGLEEKHMAALMGGVDSYDATVRQETLRLLGRADRNLPSLTLESHLEAIRTGKGVPLPVDLPSGATRAQALAEGRAEAAGRALEAVLIIGEGLDSTARATQFAEGIAKITKALRTGGDNAIWLKGVQSVLATLHASNTEFRKTFILATSAELARDPDDATTALLLTTSACEYPIPEPLGTIQAIVEALPSAPASVQELSAIALVPLLASAPTAEQREALVPAILAGLETLKTSEVKHIAKRGQQVSLIVERDLVDKVVFASKSRSLNDVLDAILVLYTDAVRPTQPLSANDVEEVHWGRLQSATDGPSRLRYDAYPAEVQPRGRSRRSPRLSNDRGAELHRSSGEWRAMGRSTLVEQDEDAVDGLALDDLSISKHQRGVATPTDRTPRLRPLDSEF